jgi:SAM-dependent methyltransferase
MSDEIDYGLYSRRFHDGSDREFKQYSEDTLRQLGSHFPSDRSIKVLDIGCGRGFALGAYKLAGFSEVKGIDIDRSQIEACLEKKLDVELIRDVPKFLSEHKGVFGLISMLDVLEHIPVAEQIPLLKVIKTALKPNGVILLKVPNASSIAAFRWRYNDFTHYTSYTEYSLDFVLRNAGFTNVEIPPLGNLEPRPSLRPNKLFTKTNRQQFKRWLIRKVWRTVLEIECGPEAGKAPLSIDLVATATPQL